MVFEWHFVHLIAIRSLYPMKKIILFTFIAILSNTIAFGQTTQKVAQVIDAKNWKTLQATGFSIQYPDSFDLDKSGELGTSFILFSRQTNDIDLFKENINLIIQNLEGQGIDLNKYVKISEDQIKTMVTDGKLLESKRLADKYRNEYQRVIYTGKQDEYMLKWLQYYWVENKQAYVLTLTCEAQLFERYLPVGEAIMKTFQLK
jgi:hypothetical protein